MFTEENARQAAEEINRHLRELECPIAAFAVLQLDSAMGVATLHRILRGERTLTETEAERLLKLCQGLQEFKEVFGVRPDWRDYRGIRSVLARWEAQVRERASRQ